MVGDPPFGILMVEEGTANGFGADKTAAPRLASEVC